MARALIAALLIVAVVIGGYTSYTHHQTSGESDRTEHASSDLASVDRFVDVAGATIRVRDEGPKDAPTLLMLHGFTFSLESWNQVAAELVGDYRIVRYDLLGHGLSGPDPQQRYAPTERAAFLGEVIQALELENPVLLGNSLGGLVSWRFAAENPDSVRALVLVSPGAFPFNGVGNEPAAVPATVSFFMHHPNKATVQATFENVYGSAATASEERVETTLAMMRGNGQAYVESLEEFTLPDPEADLKKLTAPTLIIWGEEDALIPPSDGPKMQSLIPSAKLLNYPSVGHVAQEEMPERLANDIRAFLAPSLSGVNE
ncbi:MAG: alpha/beta hydrolase [Pseudomonadota bacterium]